MLRSIDPSNGGELATFPELDAAGVEAAVERVRNLEEPRNLKRPRMATAELRAGKAGEAGKAG